MASRSRLPKEKLDRAVLQNALAKFSGNSISAMKQMLSGQTQKQPSGAFKRAAREALAPYKPCFKEIHVGSKESGGEDIRFFAADMKYLLRHVTTRCPSLAAALTTQGPGTLHAILAHDECTAGNVLNPELRQKILLFYVSFKELAMIGESHRARLPVACVAHDQLVMCRGGISGCTAAFVRQWMANELLQPFALGPNDALMAVELSIFISDLDSQRASLAAKGSAGLKCCCFCANVLMRHAAAAEADASFYTVAEHNFDLFDLYKREDLEACILTWMARVDDMPKGEKDMRERCLGYNLDKDSLWSCPIARANFHIDMMQNDSLHCYFANGIACTEIILLLKEARQHVGATVEELRDATLQAEWQRHDAGESRYWLKRLWTQNLFGDSVYKGSANQTVALLALLRWIAETIWLAVPAMADACRCFLQLCRCVDVLRECKTIPAAWRALDREQRKHQEMFAALYADHVRPKHHCRLHLPSQYEKHGIAASCWGVESAHKHYKSLFAETTVQFLRSDQGGAELSKHLLPRLLLRWVELLNERPILANGFELMKPFSPEEVREATGIEGTLISSKARLQMVEIKENDCLLFGKNLQEACLVHFFLHKGSRLYVYVTKLAPIRHGESFRIFRRSNDREIVDHRSLANFHVPAWTNTKSDTVMCLP